ncbi:trypsin-like peptidase domain-containing protein [Mycobacteroides abscessus]|uniref:trypsin-like peptidase domain-containing protein n=1 Tax=Mycobacteroides abscessus TaxID=36809 RepID=UPI0006975826|nr:trypsin-like peptidase domain-containing protein [Mycobacteroides abscessus]
MSTKRYALIAATAAAAVAVSACSPTAPAEPKPWPNAGAGGAVAAPTSATVKTPEFVWKNVDGQGHVEFDTGKPATQYGSAEPGVALLRGFDTGNIQACSIGPAVKSGFLTAGHCSTRGDSQAPRVAGVTQYAETSADGDKDLLGASTPVDGLDVAVIETSNVSPDATRIADTWPVAGVLTAPGVQQLVPVGSSVCFSGAVSGVRCGERVADEGGQLVYSAPSEHGDSGAPVFVVNEDGRAALIGILNAGDDTGADRKSTAVYLETALMASGTAVKLDPGTVPFDAPQPGLFSQRISTP